MIRPSRMGPVGCESRPTEPLANQGLLIGTPFSSYYARRGQKLKIKGEEEA
jgi:hypothetical protein